MRPHGRLIPATGTAEKIAGEKWARILQRLHEAGSLRANRQRLAALLKLPLIQTFAQAKFYASLKGVDDAKSTTLLGQPVILAFRTFSREGARRLYPERPNAT